LVKRFEEFLGGIKGRGKSKSLPITSKKQDSNTLKGN
jgi:hypothetical protein